MDHYITWCKCCPHRDYVQWPWPWSILQRSGSHETLNLYIEASAGMQCLTNYITHYTQKNYSYNNNQLPYINSILVYIIQITMYEPGTAWTWMVQCDWQLDI